MDQADYTVWRTRFGQPVSVIGAGSGTAEQLATIVGILQFSALPGGGSAATLPAVVPSQEVASFGFAEQISSRSPVHLPSAAPGASVRVADSALVAWLASRGRDQRQEDCGEIESLHDFSPADEEQNILSDALDAIFASLAP